MADDGAFGIAADAGDIAEDAASGAVLARDRDVGDRLERIHLVLRGLGDQVVAHAVLRVEPKRRLGLEAARQRDQHVAGDVLLGVAGLLRAGAVDRHLQPGLIDRLLDPQVDDARHLVDLLVEALRKRPVGDHVAADHLDIDGRGQSKIENLADDVGGQEIEHQPRKLFRQLGAQQLEVAGGRRMPRFQRDLDVGVGSADGARHVVRHIGAGQRQTDVVDDGGDLGFGNEPAQLGLDLVAQACGFLDARAGLGAHVQLELAGVDGREEVAPDPGQQRHRADARAEE